MPPDGEGPSPPGEGGPSPAGARGPCPPATSGAGGPFPPGGGGPFPPAGLGPLPPGGAGPLPPAGGAGPLPPAGRAAVPAAVPLSLPSTVGVLPFGETCSTSLVGTTRLEATVCGRLVVGGGGGRSCPFLPLPLTGVPFACSVVGDIGSTAQVGPPGGTRDGPLPGPGGAKQPEPFCPLALLLHGEVDDPCAASE